ncbi:uncharacterized protein [Rutidosis leptorrhynchoides]|uniref:uncharacterized protein n=1 Tax=Rutidosis leptorrhynchoides TaxID=125765 RepID=UPI003A996A22
MTKDDSSGSGDLTMISKLDFGDLLYLHASDITSTPLINFKLKGTENYKSWACAMELALQIKNKMGFIDKTLKKPESNDTLANQWERCNAVVLSWILGSVSDELYNGQIYSKIAYVKINCLTQGGSSVSEYYHKLNSLWKQYDILCKLPNCKCDAEKSRQEHNNHLKLMQFLMGLDDIYVDLRSNILSRDPLPSVKSAFSIVSREESHRNVNDKKPVTETAAFFSNKPKNSAVQTKLKCKKCLRIGHTIDRCFEIVGYPPRNNNLNCTKCGLTNHTVDKYFKVVGYPLNFKRRSFNQQTNSKSYNVVSEGNATTSSASTFNVSITNEQLSRLLCLLDDKRISSSTVSNMSDSGANQHMTSSEENLEKVVDVKDLNLTVNHPNGTKAKINDDLFVSFDKNKCNIQDLKAMKTVVTGNQLDGLYFFNNCAKGNSCFTNNDMTCLLSKIVWHDRLGHPADQVLHVLKNDLNLQGFNSHEPCEICHKAKPTREPFPLSEHKSTDVGQLIHLDVWGPYKVVSRDGFRYFLTIVDDLSRAVWIFLLKTKDEVYDYVEGFCLLIKTQINKTVKILRSDNGSEFVNSRMNSFTNKNGIVH